MKISKQTKRQLRRAAFLEGHGSVTEFIISAAKEKAETVIKKHDTFLASEADKATFFNAILKNELPNENLIRAAKRYKKELLPN